MLCAWAIFLLATLQADGTGSDFITRIVQDKFQGWFIVVPIVMIFVLWYLESYKKRYLIAVGIGMFAATLMHPITFTQVLILTVGICFIYFILNPSKEFLKNITPLAVIIVMCLSVLIIQYVRYSGYSPIELVGLGDAVEYGRLNQAISRLRLWILDDSYYILHPSIILQPIILLGYLFLPILILRLRKDPAARLIIPALLFLPLILYIPQFAKLAGKFVTPYLLWRLSWPLPMFAVFTIGWVVWLLIGRLFKPVNHFGKKIHSSTRVMITLSLLLIIIYIITPDITVSLQSYQERLADGKYSTCNMANDILITINQIAAEEPVSILASKSLNYCIPGIAPLANVIEYRGYGTINRLPEDQVNESLQRVLDIEYFSSSFFVDDLVMSMIDRYDVEYILVENDRMQFNMQFNQLPEIFQNVYTDHHYTLYKYKGLPTKSSIIDGNQALRERKWETAIEIFASIRELDPDNLLANIGLGHAHEGNGDIQTAFSYFLYASLTDHSEPAVHLLLADTYLTLHDPDNSILAYKQALDLDPFRSEVHKSLAKTFSLSNQPADAIKEVDKSISLTSEDRTAKYFSSKASILSSIGYYEQAEKNIYQALAIEPTSDRYVELAQILLYSEKTHQAKKYLIKAIEYNKWLDTPHFDLGLIHLEEQNYEDAIKEFEETWRLNPTNQSAFKSLGSTLNEFQGEQAAISRMTSLLQMNSLLPGPQLGMVQILTDNEHYEKSLEILQTTARILPRDTSIIEDIGDLQYDLERYDQALKSYNQSLSNNPYQIGALFGLSLLDNTTGDSDTQRGQLYRITRINPFAAWPHLSLSNIHQRMGDFGSAINETEWAIELAQDDPSAYVTLGNLYQTLAHNDQAIFLYMKAIELEPESFEAYIALAKLEMAAGDFEFSNNTN